MGQLGRAHACAVEGEGVLGRGELGGKTRCGPGQVAGPRGVAWAVQGGGGSRLGLGARVGWNEREKEKELEPKERRFPIYG